MESLGLGLSNLALEVVVYVGARVFRALGCLGLYGFRVSGFGLSRLSRPKGRGSSSSTGGGLLGSAARRWAGRDRAGPQEKACYIHAY